MARRSRSADIVVIGAGSATTSLVNALDGTPSVVVFEPSLVGGDCPYDACIPSKALLHDGALGRAWSTASSRRRALIDHRDDTRHAESLLDAGDVELVRERAAFAGPGRVVSESLTVEADHIVVATGATAVVPDLDGLDDLADPVWTDRVWTSADALRAAEAPERLLIAGGGVVGCEFARLFASFGTEVVLLEPNEHLVETSHPDVIAAVEQTVRDTGTDLELGTRPVAVSPHGTGVALSTDDRREFRADRLLLAVGRRPQLDDLHLEHVGLDPESPLPVDDSGRVRCEGSVWAIGDVVGRSQYTHAANHHGRVVADHLTGSGTRRFDDVVDAACMFTLPPMMTVGPSHAETVDDGDVVWVAVGVADSSARAATDEQDGALALAASRSTGRLVAAHGIGPSFDELVHAIIVAIDGEVPVARLVRSMYPFPTMGDVFASALSKLLSELPDASSSA
ncbi:MAG: hypothetical protein CL424_16335 [Acidimicrobiaceae bacterium]|nr:hypothetical protein [Acidimicrobiaceae bacterium]